MKIAISWSASTRGAIAMSASVVFVVEHWRLPLVAEYACFDLLEEIGPCRVHERGHHTQVDFKLLLGYGPYFNLCFFVRGSHQLDFKKEIRRCA